MKYELFLLEVLDKNGSREGVQGHVLILFNRVRPSVRPSVRIFGSHLLPNRQRDQAKILQSCPGH